MLRAQLLRIFLARSEMQERTHSTSTLPNDPVRLKRQPMSCKGSANPSAILADDLRVLYDHGSRQRSQRFDHPFPSFEETCAIRQDRRACCKQPPLVIAA